MRTERGQATVEWIGVVLLVAIALTALGRFAGRDDDRALASTFAHAVHPRVVGIRSGKRTESQPPRRRAFTVPVLVPAPGQAVRAPRLRLAGRLRLARRLRHGVGVAWRRAWFACLAYERFRWALLHPESRFPGYTMPPSEVLRIANDCISPLDLVRDWPLLTGRQP
jgi:hypothetical protein